jgi:hypothetical protein
MKGLRLLLVIAVLVTFGTSTGLVVNRAFSSTPGNVEAQQVAPQCNAEAIKGTYVMQGEGSLGGHHLSWIGVINFDGVAESTGIADESIGGATGLLKWTGDYTMGIDCMGRMHWTDHVHENLLAQKMLSNRHTHRFTMIPTAGAEEILFLVTDSSAPNAPEPIINDPTIVAWGTMKRM